MTTKICFKVNWSPFSATMLTKHAILLPGRIPGYKKDNIQLLPSSTTKDCMPVSLPHDITCTQYKAIQCHVFSMQIHVSAHVHPVYWPVHYEYKFSADEAGIQAAAYTTFCALWWQLNLMWWWWNQCQISVGCASRIAWQFRDIRTFLKCYRTVIEMVKKVFQDTFKVDDELQVPPVYPCQPSGTHNVTMCFDMAQQVCKISV